MVSKYSLWLEEYKKLTEEVKNIPLVNIKEVLSVGGQHFILSMGKDNKVEQDDHEIDPKYMRPYFTNNKDEFYDVLNILRARVKEQRGFAINVCNALTEQAVPEVVMARMLGENVSGDAFDMLKMGTRKKLDELAKIVREMHVLFDSFKITLPVAGKDLICERDPDSRLGDLKLAWGKIEVHSYLKSNNIYELSTLEDDMFFLTNYGFIERILRDLVEKLAHVLDDIKSKEYTSP